MNLRRPDRKGPEKANYESHMARVREAKTSVDCQAPRPHPLTNKGDMDQRRKHAAIEYDNKILLGRIATIVQSKTIDNEICETTAVHSSSKREIMKSRKKVELQKITNENQRMLRRIQEVSPAYNHTEWDEHARNSERHKRSISVYPEFYEKLDRDSLIAKDMQSTTAKCIPPDFSILSSNLPRSPPLTGTTSSGFSVFSVGSGQTAEVSPEKKSKSPGRQRINSKDITLPKLIDRRSVRN